MGDGVWGEGRGFPRSPHAKGKALILMREPLSELVGAMDRRGDADQL